VADEEYMEQQPVVDHGMVDPGPPTDTDLTGTVVVPTFTVVSESKCSASASTHDPRASLYVTKRTTAGTPYVPADRMVELPATRKFP